MLRGEKINFRFKTFIALMFSTTVLTAFIYFTDTGKVLETLKQGKIGLLVVAFFTLNIPILIHAFTWKEIFKISGIEIKYFDMVRVVLANIFINNITPFGDLGGEVGSTYLISKVTDYKPGKILSCIFNASLINFTPFATLLILGLVLTGQNFLLLFLAAPLSLIAIFSQYTFFKKFLPGSVLRRIPEKVFTFYRDFLEASKVLLKHKSRLLILMVLTHFAIVFDIFSVVIIGEAYGGDLFYPLILLVLPISRLANYFPTPGGSGSYEAMMIALLTFYMNITPAVAVSVVITYRALTYNMGLIFGYLALNSIGLDEEFLEKHR
jgi:uncharacterized protein (TIRG00374 family)